MFTRNMSMSNEMKIKMRKNIHHEMKDIKWRLAVLLYSYYQHKQQKHDDNLFILSI